MDKLTFIRSECIVEDKSTPRARIWKYRMDSEPLVKKLIKFDINYSEEEVRRYLRNIEGIKYNITLWPAFAPEPLIVRNTIPAVDF